MCGHCLKLNKLGYKFVNNIKLMLLKFSLYNLNEKCEEHVCTTLGYKFVNNIKLIFLTL